MIWLTDGMFPSTRSLDTREAIEEERRLFYVAITRARDELYLTYPHMRLNAGYGDMFQRPSRFLKEIPTTLVEDWNVRRALSRHSERSERSRRRAACRVIRLLTSVRHSPLGLARLPT